MSVSIAMPNKSTQKGKIGYSIVFDSIAEAPAAWFSRSGISGLALHCDIDDKLMVDSRNSDYLNLLSKWEVSPANSRFLGMLDVSHEIARLRQQCNVMSLVIPKFSVFNNHNTDLRSAVFNTKRGPHTKQGDIRMMEVGTAFSGLGVMLNYASNVIRKNPKVRSSQIVEHIKSVSHTFVNHSIPLNPLNRHAYSKLKLEAAGGFGIFKKYQAHTQTNGLWSLTDPFKKVDDLIEHILSQTEAKVIAGEISYPVMLISTNHFDLVSNNKGFFSFRSALKEKNISLQHTLPSLVSRSLFGDVINIGYQCRA